MLQLSFAQPDAIVFANLKGRHIAPERLTRHCGPVLARCREEHPELPVITLHGLRHTHVTILLRNGVAVKTVSARVGHSTPLITMTVYAHLMEGDDGTEQAEMFAGLVSGAEVSPGVSGQLRR